MYPLVSIITVNYNQTQVTRELLDSLRKITYQNVEIIVVDNGSADTSITSLPTEYPEIKYIQTGRNLGFAGGNNAGIKVSRGDYIFLVNNDVEVTPGFLEPLLEIFEKHPKAGMASPKVIYPDGKIQYAGAIRIKAVTGRGKRIGRNESDNGQYNRVYKTDLGHGAALIIPRRVIDVVGLMPEVYFLYYEEHDWCEQVKRNGYEMYFVGTSTVTHKESVTTGGDESYTKVHYLNRNRLLFMRRNFNGAPYLAGVLFLFLLAIPKKALIYLWRGQLTLLKALFNGIAWNFSNPNIDNA